MANKETAKAILNAAEELFSEKGFAETSLRNITTKAGVNLAAVNYHFGSKKELIQAVFARFLNTFCQQLEETLDQFEQQLGGETPDLNAVLMMLPATALQSENKTELDDDHRHRLGIFMRLLGLAYNQGQGHVRKFLKQEYGTVFNRYMVLVTAASPQLSNEDRFWRIHFMLGATVFTLSGADALIAMAEHEFGIDADISGVFNKLIPFLGAGFQA
ncbi:TetR/AcrR family transcriptional regulator [Bacterioplanoides sp. SCSIO 12839]|uniref:TetR/AcrR family transcriptional regulator n=1 Tax=Bacterioplanoides sp. SCSIO 12839 TaxID=2829569 RepID=UPI002102F0DA|nr:TetR/AcrR family transcriptional regulator [Bacterioplanoides sp. SCSIO 12839]UTW47201.1 TetR family transcriptional regulator [Bacterioplanoides sp. SCSIO 12839]